MLLPTVCLCLLQIKSGYIDGAARPELEGKECVLPSRRRVPAARPCPTINGCASRCSSSCKTAARDEYAARRTQQHGQGTPSDPTDQSFSIPVLPWRGRPRWSITNALGSNSSNKDFAIGPVPVEDQIARGLLPAARLRDLICDPFCGRMRGNAKP